jgi:hypothetical protein
MGNARAVRNSLKTGTSTQMPTPGMGKELQACSTSKQFGRPQCRRRRRVRARCAVDAVHHVGECRLRMARGERSNDAETVRLAREHRVAWALTQVFRSRAFWARAMICQSAQITDLVIRQIDALASIAAQEGIRLQHVKPTGAVQRRCSRPPSSRRDARGVVSVTGR